MAALPPPTRKSYHSTRVMYEGGVISYRAQFCHEFGVNPDVEELERYNTEGKARECQHLRLRRHENDDERVWYSCPDCDLYSDPNWRDKFDSCPNYHSEYDRTPCKRCGGLYLIRKGRR